MVAWGPVIGAAIGAGASFLGARAQNKAALAATRAQMDFQRESAQNRYQWTMADMKAAGLNPILAYQQGGGAALQGSSYQPVNTLGGIPGAINSAFANQKMQAETAAIETGIGKIEEEIKNLAATRDNTNTDTYLKNVNAQLQSWTTQLTKSQISLTEQQKANLNAQLPILLEKLIVAQNEAEMADAEQELYEEAPWIRQLGSALKQLNPFLQRIR